MKANKKNKIKVTSRAGRKEERTAYLCLIPAFLGVSLISYLPTLAVFVLSVFKWNGLSSPEFVGLENFQRIFYKRYLFRRFYKSDNFVRSSGCGRRYYLFSSGSPAFEYENMGTDIIPFCFLHSIPFACNRCLQRMAMVI